MFPQGLPQPSSVERWGHDPERDLPRPCRDGLPERGGRRHVPTAREKLPEVGEKNRVVHCMSFVVREIRITSPADERWAKVSFDTISL